MKKITFIFFALVSGTVFAQSFASTTATVNAEIVSPITITKDVDLDFGKIAVGPDAGSVRVSEDNTITYSLPSMNIPSNTGSAASFTITAPVGTNYSVSIPSTSLTLSGAPDMPISFTHNLEPDGNSGDQNLAVGGLLTVNGDQPAGEYTGTVKVTVSYE